MRPKKALINWAANATADAAVNGWDELAELRRRYQQVRGKGGLVRASWDEADGVGEHDLATIVEFGTTGRRVQGGEQRVLHQHAGSGERVGPAEYDERP